MIRIYYFDQRQTCYFDADVSPEQAERLASMLPYGHSARHAAEQQIIQIIRDVRRELGAIAAKPESQPCSHG